MREENELVAALAALFAALDNCPRYERGPGGMTIDAQLRRTVINQVPAFTVEEAREAYYSYLAAKDKPQA